MAPSRATGREAHRRSRDGARVSLPLSLVLLCAFLWDACGGSFLSNSLHSSFIDRRLSGREKREMQREILSILGLPGRPRPHLPVRPPASAPLFMLDLYHAVAPQERDGAGVSWAVQTTLSTQIPPLGDVISEADTVMSFVNVVEQERDPLHPRPYWKEFRFDLTPIPQGEAVTAAEFRIYKAHSYGHRGNRTLHISVYEIVKEHTNRESDLLLLDLQQVHAGDEGWLVFDVATASNRWLLNPRSNLGLRLYVETDEEHSVEPGLVGLVGRKGPRSKQPFMVTFFRQSQPALRLPRGIRHNRKKHRGRTYDLPHPNKLPGLLDHNHISDGRHACKRHELYVSFSELGWKDWVIAPQGYSAYYCDGECSYPLGSCMNATNHAIMQLVVHMLKPDEVPKACCAPTKLSPISVLFYDDNNNVILKKHRNMVVKACGCH
ncbi:bone morphogenetic protein 8A-like [Acipenser oxyrinchus oxyrinchus]|uniref:Bone morphogenetic protein 8A-like n=1 Tax=Acipenser oxyrinchus oxyrinchus TaxID=40147 RepID=A0AAD8CKC3_ACIOX|nr:bone morphogenetic protein 8A-like [Acipenser oxyrinchus oxyrinchus]